MRRLLVVAALAVAALLPLLRYHPGSAITAPAPATGSGGSPRATPTAPPVAGAAPPSGSGRPGGPHEVSGSTVDTEFGPYQVQATFSGKQITDVRIVTEPDDRHSRRIASSAEPTLRSEALSAQSSHIDTVSGATITSEAYAQSLQATIDANGG